MAEYPESNNVIVRGQSLSTLEVILLIGAPSPAKEHPNPFRYSPLGTRKYFSGSISWPPPESSSILARLDSVARRDRTYGRVSNSLAYEKANSEAGTSTERPANRRISSDSIPVN
jgi:hypothetical protein